MKKAIQIPIRILIKFICPECTKRLSDCINKRDPSFELCTACQTKLEEKVTK